MTRNWESKDGLEKCVDDTNGQRQTQDTWGSSSAWGSPAASWRQCLSRPSDLRRRSVVQPLTSWSTSPSHCRARRRASRWTRRSHSDDDLRQHDDNNRECDLIVEFNQDGESKWLTTGQRILTKVRIACRAVIDDWVTPVAACRYWRFSDSFCWVHSSRECLITGRTTVKNYSFPLGIWTPM